MEMPFLTLDMISKFLDLAVSVASATTKDHPIISPMVPASAAVRDTKFAVGDGGHGRGGFLV
ncbi:Alpha/beta-Hydrolases superfamily protein [Spatholobus suberectus]|nr:Alpha/beta-Hydrolases superfamily protein [Spatholobus suberectus]